MSTRFHGVMSVMLVAVAAIVAVLRLAQIAWGWVVGYVLLYRVGMGAILYADCKSQAKFVIRHL